MQQDSTDPTGIAAPKRNHESPGNVAGRARARKANAALQMAYASATWNEIATALGYPTPRAAQVAVERALEKQLDDADRDKMRRMAGARLERLIRAVWAKAIDPESPDQMIAVAKAREVIADHRKLFGLDAPTEVIVHNPSESELAAWVARVVAVQIPPVEEYDIIAGEIEGPDESVQTG